MYNNLKILVRNLYRNALYTWINIVGLAVSLTAAIFILLWVQDEWAYDRFYSRTNDIYKLYSHIVVNGQERYEDEFPIPLSRSISDELGEVEAVTMMGEFYYLTDVDYEGKKFFGRGSDFSYVDTGFFKVFSIPFIEGNASKPFSDAGSVVLTDEFAATIFGNESALGKRLKGNDGKDYFVSAVVKKPPHNSVLKFKCLLSKESINDNTGFAKIFVLLRPDAKVADVGKKIKEIDTHKTYYQRVETDKPYILQSLPELHLYAPDGSETGMKNVRLYLFVAIALLIIASINYVNLVTARAGKRMKEIGLRKIMGAQRLQLFVQIMAETLLMLLVSFCIATIILYLLTPYYSILTNKPLVFSVLNPTILLLYLACFLFIVILAGVYPALFISSFNPLSVFRVKLFSGRTHFSFRSILIVLQFTCSVAFILATIVMGSQQKYMQAKNLGYNRENIIIFTNDTPNRNKLYEAFKRELTQQPGIAGVAGSLLSIMDVDNHSYYTLNGIESDKGQRISVLGVDRDFFDLIGVEVIAGEGFTGTPADSAKIFLNETAVAQMGLQDPFNTRIEAWTTEGLITGIVKDFHHAHMSKPITPMMLYVLPPMFFFTIYIKVEPNKVSEAVAAAERIWKKYEPEYPFIYEFMDDAFDAMYREDIRAERLFIAFAIVAIFVSCLGLFGLATYTTETRTKEVGIRKTLGASVSNIVSMLSKEFIVLVGIGVVIGIPIAYYFMEKMLQSYAYRISITWWMILVAVLIVLVLVIATVSAQAFRAACANPVKAIKTE